ncbi:ribonuclease P protein component [Eggerthellaceae bacterium zg-1084]|uniref:Ribonuclease P protein component n=1 Tax=Berryella wangjianweii TaxID=2734634 RepID=A0A6M8J4P5_9ACTN|nr:ribonuclease P protein component [Berryella wangjianweii]NPD30937.1 ribonuclease P protein component [Berryella wangjianweii]NPD31802.1 ribonuclease P protein component [Eggerthellaceae bacterium zg-997]QKF07603.1 ribonuclease P protein component [Berryella wangjianweii]
METIKSSAEISSLFKQGRRFSTPYFTLIASRTAEQHDPDGRVVFIAGKKLGNAVWRNRAKRRLRAVCALETPCGYDRDVLLVARRPLTEHSFDEVCHAYRDAVRKAKVARAQ